MPRKLFKPLLVVAVVLAAPIVPWLLLGDGFEHSVWQWFNERVANRDVAAAVVMLLSVDLLLPIPSSLVSTLAGARLGVLPAAAASWLGMMMGATLGFLLARTLGQPLARRLTSPDDWGQLHQLAQQHGTWLLGISRPLPLLAEATVLLLGTARMAWRPFFLVTSISHAAIALAYSLLGYYSVESGHLPAALIASIAGPLVATWLARKWLNRTA